MVSEGLSFGLENDIAIDSGGKVYITHYGWFYGELLLTTNKNGSWETSVLDPNATWRQTSIEIDADDNKYISYNGNKFLIFGANDQTLAKEELQLNGSPNIKMILDPNGYLQFVGTQGLYRQNNKSYYRDLIYMTSREEFQPNIIKQQAKSFFNGDLAYSFDNNGYDNHSSTGSIAIDPNGKVHIAIVCSEGYPTSDDTLVYITNTFGDWNTFLLDRSLGCHNPEITVDANSNVHIVYSEDNGIPSYGYFKSREVKYVTFNPSELYLPFKLFTGLCYLPNPNSDTSSNIEKIYEDLLSISEKTSYVRTYSIDSNLADIPELSYNKGLNCFAGVELSSDLSSNSQAITNALNLAKKGQYSLISVVLGDSTILNGDLTVTQVISYINDLKQKINSADPKVRPKYITTADDWSIWLSSSQLRSSADLIIADIYPNEDGISIENAANYVVQIYEQLDSITSNYVVITTGWPSEGEIVGDAVPSVENQTKFMLEFTQLAKANDIPYFYNEDP